MTDKLHAGEIKNRGFSGAKWLILLNTGGVGFEYVTTVLLGQAGPAALGNWTKPLSRQTKTHIVSWWPPRRGGLYLYAKKKATACFSFYPVALYGSLRALRRRGVSAK